MNAWMAFVSILAIVAIVVVVGGIIAFLGHMIIGVFDNDRKNENTQPQGQVLDYTQYKQLNNETTANKEYDFEAINQAKAEEEAKLAKSEEDETVVALDEQEDEDLAKIENDLKENAEKAEVKEEAAEDEDVDLDSLLDEISDEVVDEERENVEEPQMNEELQSYSIDDLLNQTETEETENTEEAVTETAEETVEEPVSEPATEPAQNEEIERLKAELAEANKKLSEAQTTHTVVTLDMTEEECENRLAVLEERLKNARREFRINQKEYRPLKKMMNELEKNQTKLRRREALVAKQKVALYGVNNYVDIDKEKAQKLADELELLDGLRLSVQHCEEVINANKDRYPILEHTNNILEDQIANIEADIESTKLTLEKLREKNGNGSEGK